MSLADRFKKTMKDAGRLTRKGQLKIEKMEAESKLRDAYRELGQFVASRLVDQDAGSLGSEDPGMAPLLLAVQSARKRVDDLVAEESSL